MNVLVVANDVTPEYGLPVAAPGLRAWGIATGLRAHGHEVEVVVDRGPLQRLWRDTSAVPAAQDPRVVALSMGLLDEYVRTRRPDAVVFTNSNHVDRLGEDHGAVLVYDFFAPKMLELRSASASPAAVDRLRRTKLGALARADVVAVNGRKKRDYVRRWMGEAGLDVTVTPMVDLPFGVPPTPPTAHEGPLRVGVAGYVQPWSPPGPWIDGLLAMIDRDDLRVELVIAQHWGGRHHALHPSYEQLLSSPRTTAHDAMPFDRFRGWLSDLDVTIDVFERTEEREYAMVSRTLVALCCGTAVIHPAFTEVSPLIDRYGAGWLVDEHDGAALEQLLGELAGDPAAVARRRADAARLAAELLAPRVATAELHRVLAASS